ncbi:hypothetical protein WKW80_29795 [Variovorax humicola]|uniref:Amine oxidase domain-containing protein n=1 Tax=Variovorax humicola TaxID=1769758 RepID=A0ABU8W805_9BURK
MLRIQHQAAGRAPTVTPTVDNFRAQDVYYPDQPLVRWKSVVMGQMIKPAVLASGPLDICIVGRGAGAVAAMTEFNEIARNNPSATFNVTNFNYDSEVEEDPETTLVTYSGKYGRIFTVKPGPNYQEIGCMRFPSIALLTWNYIGKAYPNGGGVALTRFPNPGRVPTQFLFRDMNVVFEIDDTGTGVAIAGMNDAQQVQNFATMEAVKNGVINYMLTQVVDSTYSRSVGYFTTILVGNAGQAPTILGMSDVQVLQVWKEWDSFLKDYDVPLIDIVQDAIEQLINAGTIQITATRDRSYYIELFGRYGFGTGGFRALNNVTFNEIARLLIWNYSDEYLFPGNTGTSASTNTDFPSRLIQGLDIIQRTETIGKVLFIGRQAGNAKLVVVRYDKATDAIATSTHDYVIVATSHHAAQRILEPFAGMQAGEQIPAGSTLRFEVKGGILTYTTTEALLHPFDLQKGGSGNLYAALKNMHMMRTTKYFTDLPTAEFNTFAPVNPLGTKRVKMVLSDTDLAATYCLDGQLGTTNVLASYAWGDEATNEASRLRGLSAYAGSAQDATLRWRHAQDANRFAQVNNGDTVQEFWVSNMLANATQSTGYMYDWSADQDGRGGFKLDWASETAFSNALYDHYRTSVLSAEASTQPKQRLFVAGDSMSHHGGWLEGAFMTAVTAVAGVMRSQYGGTVFSLEGERLFATTSGPRHHRR